MDNKNIGKRKNTTTQKIISEIGLEKVEDIWVKNGMYKGTEELSNMLNEYVSFSTLRYLSQVCGWARPVNKKSPIFKGYLAGNIDPGRFKHLIFPSEENKNEKSI